MMTKILVADDDPMLRRLLGDMLRKQDYQVILVENGEQAIEEFFAHTNISLCILDIMMPIYTGYEVLETIREHSDVPVVLLTALGEETNELKGLQYGADDYIAKPFSYPILLTRIKNILKKEQKNLNQVIDLGKIMIDQAGHSVTVEGEIISLNPKEYALLTLFASNVGQAFPRELLLSKIWGYDYEGEIRTVDTHIKMLRKKLQQCGDCIVTVRGVGYKFQVMT